MVGNGLSEMKQKRDESAGECRSVPEEVGVKWMFRWHMTKAKQSHNLVSSPIVAGLGLNSA